MFHTAIIRLIYDSIVIQQLSVRFTTENVIKCTFSIDPGCFDKNEQSEFLKAGETLFSPSILVALKFLLVPILPEWLIDYIPAG